jgi:hypothetical protein
MRTQVLLVLATTLAAATAVYGADAKAPIPFEFSVGNNVMPAGTYTFDTKIAPGVLCVRSLDWKHAAMIITTPDVPRKSDNARIEFNQYGNVYFLSKVGFADGRVRELRKTHREKELAASNAVTRKVLVATK